MSTKKALKSIKTHIEERNHEAAIFEATALLKSLNKEDPEAAQAGLALTHMGKHDEAERCYIHAYRIQKHPLAVTALTKLYDKNEQWDKLGRFLEVQVQAAYDQGDAEEASKRLNELNQLRQSRGPENSLYQALQLLLPSSPLLPLLQPIPPPSEGYTPFQLPTYPSVSPTNIPTLPSRLPHALNLLGSLPLLLHFLVRQEALILIQTEAEVKAARMKLGAKSEKETRRDVEQSVLGGSMGMAYVDLLREVSGHPGVEEETRRLVEVKEFDFWRKLVGILPATDASANQSDSKPTSTSKAKSKKPPLPPSEPPQNANAGPPQTMTDLPPAPLFDQKPTPVPTKSDALSRTNSLAEGFILLRLGGAAEPAYQWTLDGQDQGDVFYALDLLHQYASLFPDKDLTGFIDDYCRWFRLPLPEPEEEENAAEEPSTVSGNDGKTDAKKKEKKRWGKKKGVNARERRKQRRLAGKEGTLAEDVEGEEREELIASMTKLLDKLPKSVFAHRVMARVSIQEEDWANAVTYSEKARLLLKEVESERGIKLPQSVIFTRLKLDSGLYGRVKTSLDTALGVALVPYYPPKHHTRAARLLNDVLSTNPTNTEARFALAQIQQYAGAWSDARTTFKSILDQPAADPSTEVSSRAYDSRIQDEARRRRNAKEEIGWCLVNEGEPGQGREILEGIVQERDSIWEAGGSKEGEDGFVRARAWWRLGRTEWLIGDDEAKANAEEWFSASLRALPTFAPSFTSLGTLYESATPSDHDRALKCFQKAFGLDATEAEAAEKLARGYADEDEWALVRAIATRVMEGEGGVEGVKGGDYLGGKERFRPKNGWAWKALGATEMYYRNYTKAAQAFQVSLRATPDDASTLLLLSESYVKSGRQIAALKTLDRILELEPDNWMAQYYIGDIHYQLANFALAITAFETLSSLREELGVCVGLAQAYLAYGKAMVDGGFRERARRNFTDALKVTEKVLRSDQKWRAWGWKAVADAALELGKLATASNLGENAEQVLRSLMSLLVQDDESKRSAIDSLGHASGLLSTTKHSDNFILKSAAFAFAYRAYLCRDERASIVVSAHYDLASALHTLALAVDKSDREALIKSAITAVRKALEKDAGDERLWNALGVLCLDGGKQIAQHAFIISLELYQKDPITWANLGYLYLELDDRELANSCFLKAQIIDPDYARAWLGQGLLAERNGDRDHARSLFLHAVTLSAGALLEADLAAATLVFERYLAPHWTDTSELHQPAFALKHYMHQRPKNSIASNLYGLISERLGLVEEAVSAFEATVSVLEEEFERTESHEVEVRYSIALANLGRVRLGAEAYDLALEASTNCWEFISGSQDPLVSRLRVQVRLTQAIAKFWLKDVEGSLEAFQDALNEAERGGVEGLKEDVAVLLARTLWDLGDNDARETAKTHLMECLSGESPALRVVYTLGAIALSTSDDDLLDAVLSELASMPSHKRLEDRSDLSGLVLSTNQLLTGDAEEAAAITAAALQADPWNSQIRARLARLYLASNRTEDAAHLLYLDMRVTHPELVRLRGVARVLAGDDGGMKEVLRAFRARPWAEQGTGAC